MNKEKLFSLMPIVSVKEEEVNKEIEQQKAIIEAGNNFVSQLSINRYLSKKIADYDIDERLDLFSNLMLADFIIHENPLYFYDLDIGNFAALLEEEFDLENMYGLDNLYIENLLKGQDITKKEINLFDDEKTVFEDVLDKFVFFRTEMTMGDTPPLMLMLVVKKALLGSYLAERNVESLLKGQKIIYDISILM